MLLLLTLICAAVLLWEFYRESQRVGLRGGCVLPCILVTALCCSRMRRRDVLGCIFVVAPAIYIVVIHCKSFFPIFWLLIRSSSRIRAILRMNAKLVFPPVVLWLMRLLTDILLGRLAGWAIGCTPKGFKWTIQRICVRPSFVWAGPDSWSHITVVNWTWHNPAGFNNSNSDYLLQIDRLTFRIDLRSIYRAFRKRGAVIVDLLLVEGLRFKTQRNREAALNLWEALNLLDDDINVGVLVQHARQHGGLKDAHGFASQKSTAKRGDRSRSPDSRSRSEHAFKGRFGKWRERHSVTWVQGRFGKWRERRMQDQVRRRSRNQSQRSTSLKLKTLPAVATEATRRASKYWLPTWVRRNEERSARSGNSTPSLLQSISRWCLPCTRLCGDSADTMYATSRAPSPMLPVDNSKHFEYPIGDPLRRPRWGVPVRFDINSVVVLDLELWILDLLTMEEHQWLHDRDSVRIHMDSLVVPRAAIEAGDDGKAGALFCDGVRCGDGVRGVYLGELVWTLIAQVVPKAFRQSPTTMLKNAGLATSYAVKDLSISMSASAIQKALDVTQKFWQGAPALERFTVEKESVSPVAGCRLHVHLIGGRRMTLNGNRLNVHAELSLHQPSLSGDGGRVVDGKASSCVRLWTKTPVWDQKFDLGSVTSSYSTLRIACYHRSLGLCSSSPIFIGEVVLPLTMLLIRDRTIEKGGNIVGWFPLVQHSCQLEKRPSSTPGGEKPKDCTGILKLGLRLDGIHLLPDVPCKASVCKRGCWTP